MSETNTKVIERLYAEGINRHDAAAAAAFYSPDAKKLVAPVPTGSTSRR